MAYQPRSATQSAASTGNSLPSMSNLFARPLRLAFVEKGIQSFAKVAAHVAHEDEVFALLARESALQPRQRLLGGAQRQRCIPGDDCRELFNPLLQGRKVLDHFVKQSEPRRLLRSDEPGSENEILHARRSDQRGESADARH